MTDPEISTAYLRRARAYLEAAKRVVHSEPDHQPWLHAPSLLLVGFGYEVLFKSALLDSGTEENQLQEFGHKLEAMWEYNLLQSIFANVKLGDDFPTRLKLLNDFHSSVSNYTLRYPNGFETLEAEIDPLIDALEKLIRAQERAIAI